MTIPRAKFTKGYTMLTLGWSDSFSLAPLDFVMLSSVKLANRLCEMASNLSKRSSGYKRRMEALSRKPDAVVALLEQALSAGFTASQGCALPTRMLVQDNIYDQVIAQVTQIAKTIKVGDPFDLRTLSGPVINQAAVERILGIMNV
nr:aldehyde dehydrogenase family protein [Paenibacillus sp. 23TSA30-6]